MASVKTDAPRLVSIFAQCATYSVRLAAFDRPFRVMTIGADGRSRRSTMFETRLLVNIVATDAGWEL